MYPQIIHFNRVFHYKPSILGYPYFLETPICTPENLVIPRNISGLFQGYSIGGIGSGGLQKRHFSTITGDKITSTVLCFFCLTCAILDGISSSLDDGLMEMMAWPSSSSPRNTTNGIRNAQKFKR